MKSLAPFLAWVLIVGCQDAASGARTHARSAETASSVVPAATVDVGNDREQFAPAGVSLVRPVGFELAKRFRGLELA